MNYCRNIEYDVKRNKNYRKVVRTSRTMQLVFMSLKIGEEIGMEIHRKTTQFIKVEKGSGLCIIGRKKYRIKAGTGIFIPEGKRHNIINTGNTELKLYSLYSPPEHKKGLVEKNKKEINK